MITEGQVSTELGMSRTPVREAFLLLEARGLLRLYPKKGALVTALDDDEVRELLEARIMIEGTCARIIARSDPSDLQPLADELERLLGEQRRAAASGDLLAFAHADHLFHARVVEGARNRVIDEMYATLGPRFERVTHRTIARDPDRLRRFLTEHEQLAALLASGSAGGSDSPASSDSETGSVSPAGSDSTGAADAYADALRAHIMPLG